MRICESNIQYDGDNGVLSQSFNNWIPELFKRKVDFDQNWSGSVLDYDLTGYYRRHLYFVTMTLQNGVGVARNSWSPIRNGLIFDSIYKGWYLSVCKRLLGPRYNKQPWLQPFSMAFLDVEGTRHRPAPATFQMPHIHALFLVHPSKSSRFKLLAKSGRFDRITDNRIASVDLRAFRDRDRSAERMMTYAAKYSRQTLTDGRHDKTWWVYPDLTAATYPFYGAAGAKLPPKHPGNA